jgi:hypothetical protein
MSERIAAYPNPTRGKVTVKGPKAIVSAIVIDMAGCSKEVRLMPQGDGRYILDISGHPQGAYFLTLTTGDGQQHVVRLLKQ